MTLAIYNRTQIIYALNSIANTPSNHKGTVAQLENYAQAVLSKTFKNKSIQTLIGEWELVWGPFVYQSNGSQVADNAMYVVRNCNNTSDFVVAISGTNPISKYGWVHEDFLINPMQDWPYAPLVNTAVKISNGTMLGMEILLNKLKNSDGQTLTDYLKQQVSITGKTLLLTVTGHSLGGALSPAVALALKNMQGLSHGWDPNISASIAVVPSAGPTSGNKAWAEYYNTQLGQSTTRLWNAIDIVPHVWQLDMINVIPKLYEPLIPETKLIDAGVKLAEVNSLIAGQMHQIRDDVPGLPGKIDQKILLNIPNLLEMLEGVLANGLIELLAKKLEMKPIEVVMLKAVVKELIEHLNQKLESNESIPMAEFSSLPLDSKLPLEAHSNDVSEMFLCFLDFLAQAGYQHTTAYPILMNTSLFTDLVSEIKKEIHLSTNLDG